MLYKVEKGVIFFIETEQIKKNKKTEQISTFISVVGSELQSESRQQLLKYLRMGTYLSSALLKCGLIIMTDFRHNGSV